MAERGAMEVSIHSLMWGFIEAAADQYGLLDGARLSAGRDTGPILSRVLPRPRTDAIASAAGRADPMPRSPLG
jgi:hypothetical protein